MCDCNDRSSYSSDEETSRRSSRAVSDLNHELVPLNFALYEMSGDLKQTELGVPITKFDAKKLSVVRCADNPNNFDILYDGHKLRLLFKSFPGLVKRSKHFDRELHLKIKDKCQSMLYWEVCWNISHQLCELVKTENKFCWFIEWYRIWINFCDKRLARKRLYCFEEASVALDKIILINEDEYIREYRLISEMVDAHVMLLKESSTKPDFEEGGKESVILLE